MYTCFILRKYKLDDCCFLPSEVQVPNCNAFSTSKSQGVASITLFSRNSPPQFEFGVNPKKLVNTMEGQRSNGNWMDGLRLLWLGKCPSGVKICNRCGCSTIIQLAARSVANKAWDNRWLCRCPCGGNWKIPSSFPLPKSVEPDAFLNF